LLHSNHIGVSGQLHFPAGLSTFSSPRPGKSSIPMEKGVGGTPEAVWTSRRRQNIFAPAGKRSSIRPTQQSSCVHYYLIYLVMFITVSLFNDIFSGSKRRTSKGGIKGLELSASDLISSNTQGFLWKDRGKHQ